MCRVWSTRSEKLDSFGSTPRQLLYLCRERDCVRMVERFQHWILISGCDLRAVFRESSICCISIQHTQPDAKPITSSLKKQIAFTNTQSHTHGHDKCYLRAFARDKPDADTGPVKRFCQIFDNFSFGQGSVDKALASLDAIQSS
jgi:hypothetical protein